MRPRQFDVVQVVPGASVSLRWGGWLGLALLVIPAIVFALFAVANTAALVGTTSARALSLTGLLALAVAAYFLVAMLHSLRRLAELAQVVCEDGGGPVFVKDIQHRYRFANDAAAALGGRRRAELWGRRDRELAPGVGALAFEENDRVCLERDLPTQFRESLPTVAGERSFLVGKYPLHDAHGKVAGLVGLARDITDELGLQALVHRRADEMRVWFDLNPSPVVAFAGPERNIVDANAAALGCYDRSRQEMLGSQLADLFAPEEADRLQAYLGQDGRPIPPGSVAWKHRKASGQSFDVITDMGSLPHERVPTGLMLVRDLSGEQAARSALEACESRYEDIIQSDLVIIWTHDLDGRLLRVNAAMADALGYERGQLAGHRLSEFMAEEARRHWEDYLDRARNLRWDTGLLHFVSRSGERRVWQYQCVGYRRAKPVPYVLGMAQDVSFRYRYAARLRRHDRHDPVTGCLTRRAIDALAMHAVTDQVWGCVTVDVDDFRQLNAREGQARGDRLLRDLAHLLTRHAGADGRVVRTGVDEFAIVLPNTTTAAVRALVTRLEATSRGGTPVTFSVGWAVRDTAESLASTLRRAEKELSRGRGQRRS